MGMGLLIVGGLILFAIIYLAVRLAVEPLINKPEENLVRKESHGLVHLKDIGIFNDEELRAVVNLYNGMPTKEQYEQYNKYSKILKELRELEYYTEEQYLSKLSQLKEHYKIK
jgi:hypothetical protein